MPAFWLILLSAFVLSQLASLGGLWLGGRMIGSRLLRRVGAKSHAQKLRSLDRLWPLTRIRPAIERGDTASVVTIVTALVALKSAASLALGLVTVFWLPIASMIVPAIVAAEDPDDPALLAWANRVARLQVTSHVAAAALGFAVAVAGPFGGRAVTEVVSENLLLVSAAVALSAGFAVAAGRTEALGLARRGI